MKIIYYITTVLIIFHAIHVHGMEESKNKTQQAVVTKGFILTENNKEVGTVGLFLAHYDETTKKNDRVIPLKIVCCTLEVQRSIVNSLNATNKVKDSKIERVAIITENELDMIANKEKLSSIKNNISTNMNLQIASINGAKNYLYQLRKINDDESSVGVANHEVNKGWQFHLQLDNELTKKSIDIPIIYSPEVAKIINAKKDNDELPTFVITTLSKFVDIIFMELTVLPQVMSTTGPL